MKSSSKRLTLACLIVSTILAGRGSAGPEVKADRTPLTYRDNGLYCNLDFWLCQKPEDDGVTNMLTSERAATTDSPWSFYILQLDDPARPEDSNLIARMAANGKRVIVRVSIGRLDPNPNVDELEQRLVDMLEGLDPNWLYAITLGEEQVFWNGWTDALTELYHRSKKRWPALPVYQWWTPMEVPNARSTSAWVALPADGWMIDLYGMHREEFEKKLVMTLETGKPVVHTVWSSPDWPVYYGAKSWDGGGRQVFEDQLDVCRSYNVPVAHFCVQKDVSRDGKVVEQLRWGWHAVNPIVRDWYRYIEVLAENNRQLPDTATGFRTLDRRLFDWAHGGSDQPQPVSFTLDERGRKRISLRVDLSKVPLQPGEHQVSLGEADRYFKVTCILDDSASNLKPGMGVAGAAGRSVGATIAFRIEPVRTVANLSVTANAFANHNDMGGSASISARAGDKEWSDPVRSDPKNDNHALTVQRAVSRVPGRPAELWRSESDFSKEPLRIRVQLAANAGTDVDTAASLGSIAITAAVAPRLN